ncbi:MAG: fimbrillin family protein, partial [Mucinivorans sp.]
KPEDVCFWPTTTAGSTDNLRFYAYAPFTSKNATPVAPAFSNTTDKWMKFTDYTVPADVTKQDDFMYTTAEATVQPTANPSVKLTFAHALTQIHFAARTQATNLKVEIAVNGIQVCNIGSVGTFTLTPASTPSAAWSTTIGTPIDYTIPSDATSPTTPIGYNVYVPIDNRTANVLMLIPQTTTAWVPKATTAGTTTTTDATNPAQTGSYFSINCKIYQQNGAQKVYLHGTDAAYAMLYVPFAANWTMAQSVTYQLTFGGGYDAQGNPILEPITFTTDVTVWGNNTNIKQ